MTSQRPPADRPARPRRRPWYWGDTHGSLWYTIRDETTEGEPMTDAQRLGQRLRAAREAAHMTQRDVSAQ